METKSLEKSLDVRVFSWLCLLGCTLLSFATVYWLPASGWESAVYILLLAPPILLIQLVIAGISLAAYDLNGVAKPIKVIQFCLSLPIIVLFFLFAGA